MDHQNSTEFSPEITNTDYNEFNTSLKIKREHEIAKLDIGGLDENYINLNFYTYEIDVSCTPVKAEQITHTAQENVTHVAALCETTIPNDQLSIPNIEILNHRQEKCESNQKVITLKQPHTCDICNRSFPTPYNLKRHMKIHMGIKNFKCDICNKAFTDKTCLNRHMKVHGDSKKYSCDICIKEFNNKYSYSNHMSVHTSTPKVKNHKCDICNKAFTHNYLVKLHKSIHTGIKNYKCDICDRGFTQKIHLKEHILKIHMGQKKYNYEI